MREIDVQIVERVMGNSLVPDRPYDLTEPVVPVVAYRVYNDKALQASRYTVNDPKNKKRELYYSYGYIDWKPSENMAHALQVAEQMMRHGFMFSTIGNCQPHPTGDVFSYMATFTTGAIHCSGTSDTLPMAVCLAALQVADKTDLLAGFTPMAKERNKEADFLYVLREGDGYLSPEGLTLTTNDHHPVDFYRVRRLDDAGTEQCIFVIETYIVSDDSMANPYDVQHYDEGAGETQNLIAALRAIAPLERWRMEILDTDDFADAEEYALVRAETAEPNGEGDVL